MDKQTKTLSIVAVIGIGAYLIWKQMQPKKTKTSFSGGVMGNRQVGLTGIENGNAKNSNWIRPSLNGRKLKLTGVEENMNPMNSSWIRPELNGKKLQLTGVEENMTPKNSNWIRPELNGKKLQLTGVNENARVIASPFSWK
jgi:hypothetical protein